VTLITDWSTKTISLSTKTISLSTKTVYCVLIGSSRRILRHIASKTKTDQQVVFGVATATTATTATAHHHRANRLSNINKNRSTICVWCCTTTQPTTAGTSNFRSKDQKKIAILLEKEANF